MSDDTRDTRDLNMLMAGYLSAVARLRKLASDSAVTPIQAPPGGALIAATFNRGWCAALESAAADLEKTFAESMANQPAASDTVREFVRTRL